jgi:formamidopyrimidine-DNA glycosylase
LNKQLNNIAATIPEPLCEVKLEAHLIIHLGMSGSIKVVDNDTPLEKHDHFELVFKITYYNSQLYNNGEINV